MKFIEKEFPSMTPQFERLYTRKYPPEAYSKEVKAMVRVLQERYGLTRREDADRKPESSGETPHEETQVGFAF
jgi:hypothetical protein